MDLTIQPLCSSSAGNCVTLCSRTTRLIIDCGLSSMRRTREILSTLHQSVPIGAVLLSHIHGDHISHYPLRVLDEMHLPVRLHESCLAPLRDKHYKGRRFSSLTLAPFDGGLFEIGDFRIEPFEVTHQPRCATFGYTIYHGDKKIVIATDFCQWDDLVDRFVDADFIFVESNHDLKLLRQNFNPNSRYHLPNPQTAELLMAAVGQSQRPPKAVMLGHLSSRRNTATLAVKETVQAFKRAGREMPFKLSAAPLKEAGQALRI